MRLLQSLATGYGWPAPASVKAAPATAEVPSGHERAPSEILQGLLVRVRSTPSLADAPAAAGRGAQNSAKRHFEAVCKPEEQKETKRPALAERGNLLASIVSASKSFSKRCTSTRQDPNYITPRTRSRRERMQRVVPIDSAIHDALLAKFANVNASLVTEATAAAEWAPDSTADFSP
jgi:hypothetical protein